MPALGVRNQKIPKLENEGAALAFGNRDKIGIARIQDFLERANQLAFLKERGEQDRRQKRGARTGNYGSRGELLAWIVYGKGDPIGPSSEFLEPFIPTAIGYERQSREIFTSTGLDPRGSVPAWE